MYSIVSLLPVLLAASSVSAIPQAAQPDAAALAAASAAGQSASAAAAAAMAAYTSNIAASAAAASYDAIYVTAVPSGVAAQPPAPTGPDACGPATPDPRVPDSCDSYIDISTGGAMPYNASCLNDGTGAVLNTDSCEELIPIMCTNQWQYPGEWVWASNDGCSLGSYLPKHTNPDGTPTGAMKVWPDQAKCEVLIYGSMLSVCIGSGSNQYNTIAVNLPYLPNASGTGQQANAGYGSYLIAPVQPRNVTDVPGKAAPNDIPAASMIAAASAAFVTAVLSESAILATMTGSAVEAARTDLQEYASAVLNGN